MIDVSIFDEASIIILSKNCAPDIILRVDGTWDMVPWWRKVEVKIRNGVLFDSTPSLVIRMASKEAILILHNSKNWTSILKYCYQTSLPHISAQRLKPKFDRNILILLLTTPYPSPSNPILLKIQPLLLIFTWDSIPLCIPLKWAIFVYLTDILGQDVLQGQWALIETAV